MEIIIRCSASEKEAIETAATRTEKSVNEYILMAIRTQYEDDLPPEITNRIEV